ncbi:MAG: hypothetical protein DMG11_15625 [Acidobacteria bacterium]|nr:MAG: hypothetical protein DMG11_15625 [Acidobacteriota bacterium]
MNHPQIAAFARLAKENTPPTRVLEGQKTKISRTMHGFGYDPIHDEIVVTSPLTQAILIFRGSAKGEDPPIRVIQGPRTQILGTAGGGLDRVSVDPVNSEILLPIAPGGTVKEGGVLIFDREANGDVAPKRVLVGVRGAVAVDPVHNLLIANSGTSMQIFDRTASGNARPKAVIQGPNSLMATISSFQVYGPKGWIIGGCDRAPGMAGSSPAICAWSVNDNGDVPPRWKIPVQQLTGYAPSGIALDPSHKEIIFSAAGQRIRPPSGIMNTVITFSWPEIF